MENIPRTRYKRTKSPQRRSVYIGARIGERTRHILEILSLIHRESVSAIIERAVQLAAQKGTEFGGAAEEAGIKSAHNYATDTWSPEPWVRRLKISNLASHLLTPMESAFWRRIQGDKERYWSATEASALEKADLAWMRENVTDKGLPDADAIGKEWKAFTESSVGVHEAPGLMPMIEGEEEGETEPPEL
jgi:hypothetical protein